MGRNKQTLFFSRENWKFIFFPYLILVLLHILFSCHIDIPWIFDDEFVYLSHARFFSGGNPIIFFASYFGGFGYSLFITPVFLIFKDPLLVYKNILILNSFLLSVVYFTSYYVLRKIFNQKAFFSLAVSFTVGLFPGIFLRSNTVMTENIFVVFFMLFLVLFYNFLQKKDFKSIILLSLSSVILYAIHLRGVVAAVVFLLVVGFLAYFDKKMIKKVLLSSALVIAGVLIVNFVNNYLLDVHWISHPSYKISEKIGAIFYWPTLRLYLVGIIGQFLYLIYSTYGLFLIGLYFVFDYLYKNTGFRPRDIIADNKALFLFFSLLLSGLYFVLSSAIALQTEPNIIRIDRLIYGRYNDVFLPLFIIFGFLSVYKNKKYNNKVFSALIIVLSSLLVFSLYSFIKSSGYADENVFGLIPLFNLVGKPILNIIFLALLSILFLLKIYFARDFWLKILIIFLLFFSLNVFYLFYYEIPIQKSYKSVLAEHYQPLASHIEKLEDIDIIGYDGNTMIGKKISDPKYKVWRTNYLILQYYFPDIKFEIFDSRVEDQYLNQAVIVGCDWENPGMELMARTIIEKDKAPVGDNCQALWYTKN